MNKNKFSLLTCSLLLVCSASFFSGCETYDKYIGPVKPESNKSSRFQSKPQIHLIGEKNISIVTGEEYNDLGATAEDGEGGDLTDKIKTKIPFKNTLKPGNYTIIYQVKDSDGNIATETRDVKIKNRNTAPAITILGDRNITLQKGSTFTDPGYFAADKEDGDLTDSVKVYGHINTDIPGSYDLTYLVIDSEKATARDYRHIVVTDSQTENQDEDNTTQTPKNTPPVILILGDQNITIEKGVSFTDPGYFAKDAEDGDITSSVKTYGHINTNIEGKYELLYAVSDKAHSIASAKRYINVVTKPNKENNDSQSPENTPPELTIIGGDITIFKGSNFTDPGYFAVDKEDGDITSSVKTYGHVDKDTEGKYELLYAVSDKDHSIVSKRRNVSVVSKPNEENNNSQPPKNTPPELTIIGGDNITILKGSTFKDPGYLALDKEDGDITNNVKVYGNVDTNNLGSYQLIYVISDEKKAFDKKVRTISVINKNAGSAPEITILGDKTVNIQKGVKYLDLGALAHDKEDGDLSNSITKKQDFENTDIPGKHYVIYTVTDSDGNSASATREVTINQSNNTPPEIILLGGDTLSLEIGDTFKDPGFLAYDAEDGDITNSVKTYGAPNTSKEGSYEIAYSVTDKEKTLSKKIRVVKVGKKDLGNPPTITILGENDIVLKKGQEYKDLGATAYDQEDKDLTKSIETKNNVDTETPGQYNVVYSVSDADGNIATASRKVKVLENSLSDYQPEIVLNGADKVFITKGNDFQDPGFVAYSIAEGDISSRANVIKNIDTQTTGAYPVIYSVMSGGVSKTVTRKVIVLSDFQKHVNIELKGQNVVTLQKGDSYTDQGAIATAPDGSDISYNIETIMDDIDTNTAGVYKVQYLVKDNSGILDDLHTGSITRLVIVRN